MTTSLSDYRAGRGSVPPTMLAWQVFGKGLENVGKDGQPVVIPVPHPGPRELLVRVDAAGLCFSDIKILRLGGDHPRLHGRNLSTDPIIMGHEAAVTIVKVGADIEDKFSVGDRFVVQAEIFYKGENLAFGYLLPGALEQYVLLGDEILRGDDGLYVVPLQKHTGYAEAALSEPWACVVHSYRTDFRRQLCVGGVTWMIGAGAERQYTLGQLAKGISGPRTILVSNLPQALATEISGAAQRWGAQVLSIDIGVPDDFQQIQERHTAAGFDDIIVLGHPSVNLVAATAAALGKGGTLALALETPLPEPVPIDVGRIHYDYVRYLGTSAADISQAYTSSRDPHLKAGGKTFVIGGAGPMGQMHIQLAVESASGPQLVVVSDIDDERLELMAQQFDNAAREHDRQLVCVNPQQLGEQGFAQRLGELAPTGFDDIVVMVPSAPLAIGATQYLAAGGVMNMFAGIPKGTMTEVDLNRVAFDGIRFTGTSGSRIKDLQTTVGMTEAGELSPNRSVAAIGGIDAAHDGLRAVRDGLIPGKIVIYPQIAHLPLTTLSELSQRLPEVASHLGPAATWTNETEAALLRHYLSRA